MTNPIDISRPDGTRAFKSALKAVENHSEHTALPWKITHRNGPEHTEIISGHYFIGTVYDANGRPENKANAEFIVRACNAFPDLVAALEKIAALRPHHDEENGGEVVPYEAVTWAKAALAKAVQS